MTAATAGLEGEMEPRRFAVTYDYRCPFARNAHEHVVAALDDGAGWTVEFVPFSLTEAHREDGEPSAFERADQGTAMTAMEAGIVVRDRFPDRFTALHMALFTARHDDGRDLRDEAVVRDVLRGQGVDDDAVFDAIADGWPRAVFRAGHEAAVADHQVFGVPTFIAGDASAFVRIMSRPDGDAALARATVDHVLDLLVSHPELNEFKHTSIER